MTSSPSSALEVVRSVEICARRETVFRYFTDSERFARWWGAGSTVDAKPGGALRIAYPDGTKASGAFREIVPHERVVFSYGYEGEGKPIPPGGSTITVTFAETPRGTLVTLRHTGLPSAEVAREHVQGWRYQLSLYSKVVCAEQHAGAGVKADAWFAAWAEPDVARRRELLASCAAPDVEFRDDFGALAGIDEVVEQINAVLHFMPGVKLHRVGDAVQCQGHALVRWEARDPQGNVKAKGTNSVSFAPDGRMSKVIGFWGG
jgi:uncharacterized protein YndB with AHSA1/START domain